MADSLALEDGEIREEVLPEPPPTFTRQLSSRYSNQGSASTCSIHCCTKVLIRFMKTFFSTRLLDEATSTQLALLEKPSITEFIDDSTDEQFEYGNPCNMFYTEEMLRMPMTQSFESIIIRSIDSDKCTSHPKELIHVILYKYIYTILLNKFRDITNSVDPEINYICFFLTIFPVTVDIVKEVIGIDPTYIIERGTNEELKPSIDALLEAIDDVVIILTIFKQFFGQKQEDAIGTETPLFLYSIDVVTSFDSIATSLNASQEDREPAEEQEQRQKDEEEKYFLDRAEFYEDEDDDEDPFAAYLYHLFSMMKKHIIDEGYYCTVLIAAKDNSLAHYLTIEDISDSSILLKDSYGQYKERFYKVLDINREKGIVTIPIDTLLERMKYIRAFQIYIVSADRELNEKCDPREDLFNMTQIATDNINRFSEGNIEPGQIGTNRSILSDAALAKYYHLCNVLLDNGADPNAGDFLKPFLFSTRYPELNAVTVKMLEKGADISTQGHYRNPESPFVNIASQDKNASGIFENIDLFRLMLTYLNTRFRSPDFRKGYINFPANIHFPLTNVNKPFLERGQCNTPLKFAIYRNNVELCRLLIENGAAVHEENVGYNVRPIVFAINKPDPEPEIIAMIIKANPVTKETLATYEKGKITTLAEGSPDLRAVLEGQPGGSKRSTRRIRKKRTRRMHKKRARRSIKKRVVASFLFN